MLAVLALIFLVLNVVVGRMASAFLPWTILASVIMYGLVLQFFRNPVRTVHIADNNLVLTKEDIIAIVRYIVSLINNKAEIADIYHLSNRRVRTVGEQFYAEFGVVLARMARTIRERLDWLDKSETIAVVGARRSSSYGLEVAGTISREIAESGRTVISGMALGVDGSAHRGALHADGRTVAVLPVGPEQHYPRAHKRMHDVIKDRGLVLSEMPPGVGPISEDTREQLQRWSFPARNRIVAALAGATILTEASIRSGSMITAGMAKDLDRPLGAVPAPITTAAQGTNELIRNGAALIRNGQDAIELV